MLSGMQVGPQQPLLGVIYRYTNPHKEENTIRQRNQIKQNTPSYVLNSQRIMGAPSENQPERLGELNFDY